MTPLIIGFGTNGWNVYRSLRREGLKPVALDDQKSSTYWHAWHIRPVYVPELTGQPLLDALHELTASGETYLLISALEGTIHFLNQHRDQVPAGIRLCFPDAGAVEMMLDKRLFYEHARRLGLPLYPMYFFEGADWRVPDADFRFPCILKSRRKMYVPGMPKAYRINNRQELGDAVAFLEKLPGLKAEDMLMQEWVSGSDSDVFFCLQYYDQKSSPVASFVGRKLRQWPPLIGGTSAAVPADVPEALEMSTRFFQSCRMHGICSMEFKRSTVDGRLYMIEPTVCRADYQEGVAVANGCNIPYAMFLSECGMESFRVKRAHRPAVWVSAADDIQSARAQSHPQPLNYWQWWRTLPGPKEYAVYTPTDPGPFIELLRRKVAGRLRKLVA
jgi:D-aspartate ligase